MNKHIYLLDTASIEFPHPSKALKHPDGLLAIGGNLAVSTLLKAYQTGIFPWFNEGEPILWWSPDPRMVIRPDELHLSRSMKRLLKRSSYKVTMDLVFTEVIEQCSRPRAGQDGTWITDDMKQAYFNLFTEGYAHSVEVWNSDDILVGGLYGVAIDKVFFGESMFSLENNTSKLAMIHLCGELKERGYQLVDCQVPSDHLKSLGATLISRKHFLDALNSYCRHPLSDANWKLTWQWKPRSNERP